MPDVTAPYNFVRLSQSVLLPAWSKGVSMDRPFKDGISGSFTVTMKAEAPICVGGARMGWADEPPVTMPFEIPGQGFAIPGSSIKGAIRNVFEIATFSRMRMVDGARRFGSRDLSPGGMPYQARMTYQGSSSSCFGSRSRAGWLERRGDRWFLAPAEYARIERCAAHSECSLEGLASRIRGRSVGAPKVLRAGGSESSWASAQYEAWSERVGDPSVALEDLLGVCANVGPIEWHEHSDGKSLHYRKVGRVAPRGQIDLECSTPGMLVFTGLPNTQKHLEFVFFDTNVTSRILAVPLATKVVESFLDVQLNEDGTSRPDWKLWVARLDAGQRVPIFYLTPEVCSGLTEIVWERHATAPEHVEAIGLSMMFQTPGKFSVRDAIGAVGQEHLVDQGIGSRRDLADLVFGWIPSDGEVAGGGLRGRVTFGHGLANRGARLHGDEPVRAVLSSPKASFFPAYLRQESGAAYRTYDDGPEARGWKRYPVRRGVVQPPGPGDNAKIETRFHPLDPEGLVFSCRVCVHNLRPFEFGALCWAIELGGGEARHSLGMAKPMGYGRVQIEIDDSTMILERNDQQPVLTPEEARLLFVKGMDEWLGTRALGGSPDAAGRQEQHCTFLGSPQIRALLAMAELGDTPDPIREGKLRAMVLTGGKDCIYRSAKRSVNSLPEFTADIPPVTQEVVEAKERHKRKCSELFEVEPLPNGAEDRAARLDAVLEELDVAGGGSAQLERAMQERDPMIRYEATVHVIAALDGNGKDGADLVLDEAWAQGPNGPLQLLMGAVDKARLRNERKGKTLSGPQLFLWTRLRKWSAAAQ